MHASGSTLMVQDDVDGDIKNAESLRKKSGLGCFSFHLITSVLLSYTYTHFDHFKGGKKKKKKKNSKSYLFLFFLTVQGSIFCVPHCLCLYRLKLN